MVAVDDCTLLSQVRKVNQPILMCNKQMGYNIRIDHEARSNFLILFISYNLYIVFFFFEIPFCFSKMGVIVETIAFLMLSKHKY